MRRSVHPVAVCIVLVGLSLSWAAVPSAGDAQLVRGRLVEAEEEVGVGGAMITLVSREGRAIERVLTRSGSGLFQLKASGPGEYRLRADRIGYATTYSDYFRIAGGDTLGVEMAARVEAVSLEGIEAEGNRRCRVRPEEGLAVYRVWEEARKALIAAAWTQERGMYHYEMLRIKRNLDREGRRIESEDRSYGQGYSEAPYVARPADSLAVSGFARFTESESVFWAPDAGVLLSDAFLDTHCFRVEAGGSEAPGRVGLAFEPLSERTVPEISGTLWVDPVTARLSWLEYRYVNLNIPRSLLAASPRGRVEFQELPNGTWIVTSWSIRMPRPGVVSHFRSGRRVPVPTLDGIAVARGEVLRVHGSEGVVFEGDPGKRIIGTVFDTLRIGLPGARVFVEGTGTEVVTDSAGHFELTHLRSGVYTLYFTHPYLDPLLFLPEPIEAKVEEGKDPLRVDFFAPTLERVIDEVCDGDRQPEAPLIVAEDERLAWPRGILTGRVTDPDGNPVSEATVVFLSRTYEIEAYVDATAKGAGRLREGRRGAVAKTGGSGVYRICWVPVGAPLEVAVLKEGEALNPSSVDASYDLSDFFPGRVRTLTVVPQSPFATLNLRTR